MSQAASGWTEPHCVSRFEYVCAHCVSLQQGADRQETQFYCIVKTRDLTVRRFWVWSSLGARGFSLWGLHVLPGPVARHAGFLTRSKDTLSCPWVWIVVGLYVSALPLVIYPRCTPPAPHTSQGCRRWTFKWKGILENVIKLTGTVLMFSSLEVRHE